MPFPNGWWVAETTMATGLSVQRERQRRRGQEAEQVYVYHFHWNAAMDDKTSLNLLLPPCLGKIGRVRANSSSSSTVLLHVQSGPSLPFSQFK